VVGLTLANLIILHGCSGGPDALPLPHDPPASITVPAVAVPDYAAPTCAIPPLVVSASTATPIAIADDGNRPSCQPQTFDHSRLTGVVDTNGADDFDSFYPAWWVLIVDDATGSTRAEKWWDRRTQRIGFHGFAVRQLLPDGNGDAVAIGDDRLQVLVDLASEPRAVEVCLPSSATVPTVHGCLTTRVNRPEQGWDADVSDRVVLRDDKQYPGFTNPRGIDVNHRVTRGQGGYLTALVADRVDDREPSLAVYDRHSILQWTTHLPVAYEDGPYFLANGDILVNASHPVRFDPSGCVREVAGWPEGRSMAAPNGEVVFTGHRAYAIGTDDFGLWTLDFPEDVVIEAASADTLVGSRGGKAWMAFVDPPGTVACMQR
jgi:hypothetical protein